MELGIKYIEEKLKTRAKLTLESYMIAYSVLHTFLIEGELLITSSQTNQKLVFSRIFDI